MDGCAVPTPGQKVYAEQETYPESIHVATFPGLWRHFFTKVAASLHGLTNLQSRWIE